jgi:hypothetical protein
MIVSPGFFLTVHIELIVIIIGISDPKDCQILAIVIGVGHQHIHSNVSRSVDPFHSQSQLPKFRILPPNPGEFLDAHIKFFF